MKELCFRVANRDGGECGLGAGQVLDTDPSGRVKIWWASKNEAEKFSSSCWPQDIYKVCKNRSNIHKHCVNPILKLFIPHLKKKFIILMKKISTIHII